MSTYPIDEPFSLGCGRCGLVGFFHTLQMDHEVAVLFMPVIRQSAEQFLFFTTILTEGQINGLDASYLSGGYISLMWSDENRHSR